MRSRSLVFVAIEGERAVANAPIHVEGVQLGRADDGGRFRIRVGGFSAPTCRVSVDDGTGAVEVSLSGCSPSVPSEPEPDPVPEPDPEPDPDPTPPPPEEAPILSGILLDPSSVTAGDIATGTVLLTGPAPSGSATVALQSNATSVRHRAAGGHGRGAGDTAASFAVSAQPVASTAFAAISGNFTGITRTATLTVHPAGVTLSTLTLAPTLLVGGEDAVGTVTLTGPAPSGGAVVGVSSSNTDRATVPNTVVVAVGETSATFPVATLPVASPASVSVTGT